MGNKKVFLEDIYICIVLNQQKVYFSWFSNIFAHYTSKKYILHLWMFYGRAPMHKQVVYLLTLIFLWGGHDRLLNQIHRCIIMLFLNKVLPFLTWFLPACGSVACQRRCLAISVASEASWTRLKLVSVPGNVNGDPECAQIEAYTAKQIPRLSCKDNKDILSL